MSERAYTLGERVIASTNGTGVQRKGVVTGVLNAGQSSYAWNGELRYMVKFDRDHGNSGPCVVYRAEGEREAVSSNIGSGS